MVPQGRQAQLVQLDLLVVQPDLLVQLAQREPPVQPDLLDRQVQQALLVQPEPPAQRVQLAQPVHKVSKAFLSPAQLVQPAQQVVLLVQRERLELLVRQVQRVQREPQVQLALPAQPVQPEPQERQGQLVQQDLPVQPVLPEQLAHWEQQDLPVQPVHKAFKDFLLQVRLAQLVLLVQPAQKEQPDQQEQPAQQVLLD